MGRNDEVRRIAYSIWEREGRPEGHALEHWQRAEKTWASQQKPSRHSTPASERMGHSVPSTPRTPAQSSSTSWPS
jgi:hypothetical protein